VKRAKSPRKALVRKADTAFSLYVRNRDRRCVTCGSTENPTCGHLISRVCYSVRWFELNGFQQCLSCNLRHEYRPEIFTQWFIKTFSIETYDALVALSKEIRKFTNAELEEIAQKYKEKAEVE